MSCCGHESIAADIKIYLITENSRPQQTKQAEAGNHAGKDSLRQRWGMKLRTADLHQPGEHP
jgi:hypothetical protein